MRREEAYVSLGSNLGDRRAFLLGSLEQIRQQPGVDVTRVSSLYETEPQDVRNQPCFLNMVAAVTTELEPHQLLAALQAIEEAFGRLRSNELVRGPRTLDLDILLFGQFSVRTATLVIPHPRMLERRFVLEPLFEIAPNLRLPDNRATLREYLDQLNNKQSQYVRRIPESNE